MLLISQIVSERYSLLYRIVQDQLVQVAKLSDADMAVIDECRRPQTKLGLGYQLGFVRLFNQFPPQMPFEPIGGSTNVAVTLQQSLTVKLADKIF